MSDLPKIMKHINKLKNENAIFDYLDDLDINNIFNKSNEDIQIDFIKLLLSKLKEDIKFLLVITISNINTFKTLLEWGIKYDDYNLCYFLFHHKDKKNIITSKDYTSYEEKTKNKKIALLINEFKIKEAYKYDVDSDDSDDTYNSDDSDDSDDFFDSDDSDNYSSKKSPIEVD